MLRRLRQKRRKKGETERKEDGRKGEEKKDGVVDRKQRLEDPSLTPLTEASPPGMASGDPSYKVILCGEYGVGKSSIFRRFLNDTFIAQSSNNSTLGLDQSTRPFTVGNTSVKLTLWDTGGMERMSFIGASYYRGANAALLVYNSNDKETFSILSQYILDIAMNAEGAKIFLCGNSATTENDDQGRESTNNANRVDDSDMETFMAEGGDMLSGVYSVDCRKNVGLEAMFQDMARVLHEDALSRLSTLPRDVRKVESVELDVEARNKKCC